MRHGDESESLELQWEFPVGCGGIGWAVRRRASKMFVANFLEVGGPRHSVVGTQAEWLCKPGAVHKRPIQGGGWLILPTKARLIAQVRLQWKAEKPACMFNKQLALSPNEKEPSRCVLSRC